MSDRAPRAYQTGCIMHVRQGASCMSDRAPHACACKSLCEQKHDMSTAAANFRTDYAFESLQNRDLSYLEVIV